jgi:flagellar basal body-associated protein FliL
MKAKSKSLKIVMVSVLVSAFFIAVSFYAISFFSTKTDSRSAATSQNLSIANEELKKMELPSYYTIFRFFITKIPFKAEKN